MFNKVIKKGFKLKKKFQNFIFIFIFRFFL